MKLSILILNFNSSHFIGNSLYALERLSKNPYQAFILDNGSLVDDQNNLKRIVSKYKNVNLEFTKSNLKGSFAHAEGLNKLVAKVDTSYFSIIDPDASWLAKNWDEILIKEIKGSVKAIGTQASSAEKPMDFPLVYAILFETKPFKKLKINFMPGDLSKFEDVGYEIREKFLKAGYVGRILKTKNTRVYKKGPFNQLVGISEYYLNNNYDKIFASHFGRGSSMGSTKYLQGLGKYIYSTPLVGKFLLKRKGMTEMEKWINICKSIIDSQ